MPGTDVRRSIGVLLASASSTLLLACAAQSPRLDEAGARADVRAAPTPPRHDVAQLDFELAPGVLTRERVTELFNAPRWSNGVEEGRLAIVESGSDRGRVLEVSFPPATFGPNAGGVQFYWPLPGVYEELYCAYLVRFADGFDFVRGGKLPGLSGGPGGGVTGSAPADGTNGWSARGQFLAEGRAAFDMFNLGQQAPHGDSVPWGEARFSPGRWHHVQHHVRMNTPGKADGVLEAWLDGRLVLSRNDFSFRASASLQIDHFMMTFFFGGNDATYATTRPEVLWLDDLRIATGPIVEPSERDAHAEASR